MGRVGEENKLLALYLALINDEANKKLFEEIYKSYRKQMLAVAVSILKNKADAEDAVQEVFYRIAAKHIEVIAGIKENDDRRNYLLKAVKNTALNLISKNKTAGDALDSLTEFEKSSSDDFSDNAFIDMICNKIEYDNLVEAIRNLDETYRDVLYYHFVVELSAPAIAKALGRSLTAVKKQLVRGKKQLLHNLGLEEGGI